MVNNVNDETQNITIIKPTIVKQPPVSAIDVSEIILNKINPNYKSSDNNYIKGMEELKIYYSIQESEFYIKKGDVYKVLKWRKQKNRVNNKNYVYEYVLIPYKKHMPLKLLKGNWMKQIAN
jgi:hypothetical protein